MRRKITLEVTDCFIDEFTKLIKVKRINGRNKIGNYPNKNRDLINKFILIFLFYFKLNFGCSNVMLAMRQIVNIVKLYASKSVQIQYNSGAMLQIQYKERCNASISVENYSI